MQNYLESTPRDIPPALRTWVLRWRYGCCGVVLAILWTIFLTKRFAGVDLFQMIVGKAPYRDHEAPTIYLFACLIGTPLALAACYLSVRRAFYMARFGEFVVGKIQSVGRVEKYGAVSVRYAYSYKGTVYIGATDMPREHVNPGDRVELLVDPKKPKRSALLDLVIPFWCR